MKLEKIVYGYIRKMLVNQLTTHLDPSSELAKRLRGYREDMAEQVYWSLMNEFQVYHWWSKPKSIAELEALTTTNKAVRWASEVCELIRQTPDLEEAATLYLKINHWLDQFSTLRYFNIFTWALPNELNMFQNRYDLAEFQTIEADYHAQLAASEEAIRQQQKQTKQQQRQDELERLRAQVLGLQQQLQENPRAVNSSSAPDTALQVEVTHLRAENLRLGTALAQKELEYADLQALSQDGIALTERALAALASTTSTADETTAASMLGTSASNSTFFKPPTSLSSTPPARTHQQHP